MGEHVSADCKTPYVRQSVWNSKEQDPKTENAVRDIDVCSDLAVMLKSYIYAPAKSNPSVNRAVELNQTTRFSGVS
jgi:hypothetical protein